MRSSANKADLPTPLRPQVVAGNAQTTGRQTLAVEAVRVCPHSAGRGREHQRSVRRTCPRQYLRQRLQPLPFLSRSGLSATLRMHAPKFIVGNPLLLDTADFGVP